MRKGKSDLKIYGIVGWEKLFHLPMSLTATQFKEENEFGKLFKLSFNLCNMTL